MGNLSLSIRILFLSVFLGITSGCLPQGSSVSTRDGSAVSGNEIENPSQDPIVPEPSVTPAPSPTSTPKETTPEPTVTPTATPAPSPTATSTQPAIQSPDLKIEAENAKIQNKNLGTVYSGSWIQWSNGEAGDYFSISQPGDYDILVYAKGTAVDGKYPKFILKIDSLPKAYVELSNSSHFQEYRIRVNLPEARTYQFTAAFINDEAKGSADRNLWIDKFLIRGVPGLPSPLISSDSNWNSSLEETESAVLQKALLNIEQNRKSGGRILIKNSSGTPLAHTRVKIKLKKHAFKFGASNGQLDGYSVQENALYKNKFLAVFNAATVSSYWSIIETSPGVRDFSNVDRLLKWGVENKLALKLHPLLWGDPEGLPGWMSSFPTVTQQEAHMRAVLDHSVSLSNGQQIKIKDALDSVDVVNEPFHRTEIQTSTPYTLARQLLPGKTLNLNEYATFHDESFMIYQYFMDQIKSGVSFDSIGMQFHHYADIAPTSISWVKGVLDFYTELGKPIQFSEVTFPSSGVWDEQLQNEYIRKFYTLAFSHPSVTGITWWDFADRNSWKMTGGHGGLLRDDFSEKPAYATLKNMIKTEWTTDLTVETNAEGGLEWRGFLGDYEISLESGGSAKPFTLKKEDATSYTFSF